MTELLTAAQMRAIEEAAIASGEVTGLELMERAGRGVVEAILDWRPELATAPHRAVVLCGPGNNGGDGFVVARLLKERGWVVEVFLYGDEAKLPPDAAENCRRWREVGEIRGLGRPIEPVFDVVVDALFGVGLTRPIDPQHLQDIWNAIGVGSWPEPIKRKFIVSIDVPSGLCADSGRPIWVPAPTLADGVRAQRRLQIIAGLTVTFSHRKLGHCLEHGPDFCNQLVTVDLKIPAAERQHSWTALELNRGVGSTLETTAPVFGPEPMKGGREQWLQERGRHAVRDNLRVDKYNLSATPAHKYAHGHALIVSGGVGKGGAARLAARGALRIGAGLVTLGPPPAAVIENAAQLNAIMLRPVAGADALAEILTDERFNAVCLGPGLGVGAHTLGLVAATLAARRGTVLDADALTSFAEDPAKLFALLHPACVLTPHMGEFARLFPDIAEKLNAPATKGPAYSKVDAAREAAARAGCVVLLKGPDTVIVDPQGRAAINSAHYERAAPWLATAGSGDVLAGMITGLLARGFAPMAAAETAAWLHVEAARKFGPGLIAEDIPEMIPAVFRDLGL